MGDESPDSSTEQRLDRLESVVKQQNETIREMLPGRRAVVAGGAAAAFGFGAGAGSASGQSAAGQVGTESEPVDVEGARVNAEIVNTDEIYTVETLTELDSAVDNYDTVIIRPGSSLSGSTTVTVDTSPNREVQIIAYGATVSGEGVVLDITGENSWPDGGRTVLMGGDWGSDATAGSRAIRVTDSENNVLRPHFVRDAEEGIELRNEESFSEGNRIELTDSDNVGRTLAFKGVTATGGSNGTDSFKNTVIDIKGHVNSGGTVLYTEHANLYDSRVDLSAFVSGNRTAFVMDGSFQGLKAWIEVENTLDDGTGTGVVEGSNAGIEDSPGWFQFHSQGSLADDFDVSTPFVSWEQDGKTVTPQNTATGGRARAEFRSLFSIETVEVFGDGNGIQVTSPDGSVTKTFGVRNDGTWGQL